LGNKKIQQLFAEKKRFCILSVARLGFVSALPSESALGNISLYGLDMF